MLSLAVMGIAALLPAQQSITIISAKESPFVLRDKAMDIRPQQDVIESGASDALGFFLIRETDYNLDVYNAVISDVSNLRVDMIVRKEVGGRFTAWNMGGLPVNIDVNSIPPSIQQSLKEGELAISTTHLLNPKPVKHSAFVFEPVNSSYVQINDTVHSWARLGKAEAPFVNVRTTVHALFDVGSMPVAVGSSIQFEGITFTVAKDMDPAFMDGKDCVSVTIDPRDPKDQYFMKVELDGAAIRKDYPNGRSVAFSSTISKFAHLDLPPGKGSRVIYVSSSMSKQYWKSLMVSKNVNLTGYIGHVPTRPGTSPR